jgi:hypothetical protein
MPVGESSTASMDDGLPSAATVDGGPPAASPHPAAPGFSAAIT